MNRAKRRPRNVQSPVDGIANRPVNTAELRDAAFSCLEGCGFCCTFQPEVSGRELGLLRRRLAPNPVPVGVDGEGRTYLGLQNKCGACTLLERRGCTQYDLRPAHCRYFPFHLHFAETPEAYLNYTCRGVEHAPGGNLDAAFKKSVLGEAKKDALVEHERLAKEAYGSFHRLAKRHGVWGDADTTAAALMGKAESLFTSESLTELARAAGLDANLDALHQESLVSFGADDVTHRPFYLTEDLRWVTFERDGEGGLKVLDMDEKGTLTPTGAVDGLAQWAAPDVALAKGLATYLGRLVTRRLFVGSAYALVDDDGYETTVEEAVHARFIELVCDLSVRARILRALGIPDERLADEVARFYDSTFLDTPTIGGFL